MKDLSAWIAGVIICALFAVAVICAMRGGFAHQSGVNAPDSYAVTDKK